MQNYLVELKSEPSKSFRAVKAANSLDIDLEKKLLHELKIENVDLETFNIGLIIGASGSGKTTLAKKIFGEFNEISFDASKPIIDLFPENMSYEDCSNLLLGVGLSSVPCWLKPFNHLSNGQQMRARTALELSQNNDFIVIDEFTSVVDRTVAKAMSLSISKHIRRNNKKIILISCHYDILEWLDPDWVIDCNLQSFIKRDRGLLRQERISFNIREVDRKTWKQFSKYHYLSDKLPGGKIHTFGIFIDEKQIGFQCFCIYNPNTVHGKQIFHSNRTVIHPDYVGFGLGMKLIDETSKIVKQRENCIIMGCFSSVPVYKSMIKNKNWILKKTEIRKQKAITGNLSQARASSMRKMVKTFSFEYIGE